jgi:sugar O-acyltransferase (sialic acid O-acetyltransferase NeuD family)
MEATEGAVIVGAGGHGRGVLETLRRAHPERPILGFVDENPARHGDRIAGYPVLGGLEWLAENRRRVRWLYLGLGHPRDRHAVAQRVRGFFLPPLVHPTAVLHGDVVLGEGAFVGAGVVVAHATRLGPRVLVNLNATVGHDVVLEADVSVGPGANLGGGVHVEAGAFVGMNATLPPGTRVGAWSEVAAGSVVLRPVPAGHRVLGNPARDLGPIPREESPDKEVRG